MSEASAHCCVGAALTHSCVSAPSAYSFVSVASAHSCVSAYDIGVGCLAVGEKKCDIWLCDKASAMLFFLPGTCISATVKLWLVADKNRHR